MEETMKKTIGHLIIVAMLVAAGAPAFAQQAQTAPKPAEKTPEPERVAPPDRAVVPLSNPAKPAKIEASVMRGSITVKGYDGKEVIAEAQIREKALFGTGGLNMYFLKDKRKSSGTQAQAEALAEAMAEQNFAVAKLAGPEAQKEKKERSHEGMRLITAAMTGLTVEEDNNTVTVSTDSWKYSIDLTIQVPYASSLELSSTTDGKILVENVNGDLEINGGNGSVMLRNVSGSAVVHTMNGDIEAVLSKVSSDKPLSFSNMNGDLDITLPADVKVNIKLKSQMGNVYSDFDVVLKQTAQKVEASDLKGEKGQYRISFDKAIYGAINGGGQEITLTTFNGDIFIRKKK
jgi:DUF4097 and DUF4098 domain-containing protein YvlB